MAVVMWDGIERRRRDPANRARRAGVELTKREFTEVWSGLFLVVLGGWFLLPFSTFSASTSYTWVALTPLSEQALGTLLFGIGFTVLAAAIINRHGLRLAALLGAVWAILFMGLLYWLSTPASAGLAIFVPLALAPIWALLRLEGERAWARRMTAFRGSPPRSRR
jgi:hypothetical protein